MSSSYVPFLSIFHMHGGDHSSALFDVMDRLIPRIDNMKNYYVMNAHTTAPCLNLDN